MLIQYAGVCDWCGKDVKAGEGDFQSIGSLSKKQKALYTGANYKSKWLIRCFKCKGLSNGLLLKVRDCKCNKNN